MSCRASPDRSRGPNQLAGYFDLAIPLLLARALAGGDRSASPALTLAALADVLTLSRSGVLAALVGCVAVLAIAGRLRLRAATLLPAAGAIVLAVGLLATFGLLPRFLSVEEVGRENGLATRGELWRAAIALWVQHPLLGVGAGNYELELPSVGLIGVRTHANSAYLQALAEGGIPLFLATVWTAVAAVRTLWPRGPRAAAVGRHRGGQPSPRSSPNIRLLDLFPENRDVLVAPLRNWNRRAC